MKKLLIFLIIGVTIFGCGHRKSPTGGPKDSVKPEILSISPQEFSDIQTENIEVVFSKPIDRSTVISGLYIYPPILKKKFKWEKNVLTIKILEDLADSTNYFFSFTTAIKGEHENELFEEYTFVFFSGSLSSNRISGNILYEDPQDDSFSVKTRIMTSDSTFILHKEFQGKSFELDNLNNIEHIIEAYMDTNQNNKYDYGKEPYCYQQVAAAKFSSIDFTMNYADSLAPGLSSAKCVWNNLIELTFSEEVEGFGTILLSSNDSIPRALNIIEKSLNEDKLLILTEPLDTLQYKIKVTGLVDLKLNQADTLQIIVEGSALVDSLPPVVTSVYPRNGATISDLEPEIRITFNEIIPRKNLSVQLMAMESNEEIALEILTGSSDKFILKPQKKLQNYSTYVLSLEVADQNDNTLKEDTLSTFIPIDR